LVNEQDLQFDELLFSVRNIMGVNFNTDKNVCKQSTYEVFTNNYRLKLYYSTINMKNIS